MTPCRRRWRVGGLLDTQGVSEVGGAVEHHMARSVFRGIVGLSIEDANIEDIRRIMG